TPGVQIPFSSLKAELEYPAPHAEWIAVTDAAWLPDREKGTLQRIEPRAKDAKLSDPIAGINQPCGGAVSAFNNLWMPSCGEGSLLKIDSRAAKVSVKAPIGRSSAYPAIAAGADSIWMLTDDKTTLSRVDPEQAAVVAEIRLPAGCGGLISGEAALW